MNKQYNRELETAKEELADVKLRGSEALGDWEALERELFTPQEIEESRVRIALMGELIKARNEKGITQKKLEEMSGVRQPVIARMEKGRTSPNLDTVIRVLNSLGKTLYVGDFPAQPTGTTATQPHA
jgi:DNA-binding XRE family transcriptional regulator